MGSHEFEEKGMAPQSKEWLGTGGRKVMRCMINAVEEKSPF